MVQYSGRFSHAYWSRSDVILGGQSFHLLSVNEISSISSLFVEFSSLGKQNPTHPVLLNCNTSSVAQLQYIQCCSIATHPMLLNCNTSGVAKSPLTKSEGSGGLVLTVSPGKRANVFWKIYSSTIQSNSHYLEEEQKTPNPSTELFLLDEGKWSFYLIQNKIGRVVKLGGDYSIWS